jgi:4a-hydroxytetrahydrobiopterin dehydratase
MSDRPVTLDAMTVLPLEYDVATQLLEGTDWRVVFNALGAVVPVSSLRQATEVVAIAAEAAGPDGEEHLRADVRADRVDLALQDQTAGAITSADADLARDISAALRAGGYAISGPTTADHERPVQLFEVAIDAMDIAAIRPFWKAVLAYVDDPLGIGHPAAPLIDPAREMPGLWFQQMTEPRPQRNRIHFDVAVSHEEAERRVAAAIDAGGVLVNDRRARSFWILADPEGNEICVCTWQDRAG